MTVSTNNGLHVCMEWYTTCFCSFSPCTTQKWKFPKLSFFDIVATHNDHPTYVKHVLDSIYVFFTLIGYLVFGGGVSQWSGTQPAYAVCHLVPLKNRIFRNLFF